MKVLHISGAKGWGGNEQQMMYIIPELEKHGIINLVLGIKDSILQKECLTNKIKFIEFNEKKINKFNNYLFAKKLISIEKPDILHLHTSDSLTFFTIADLLFHLKTKTVFSKKGMGSSGSFLSKIKYNYKGINSTICVSKSVQHEMGAILSIKNKAKTIVIHDCVSLSILKESPSVFIKEKYRIPTAVKLVGNIGNHAKAKDLTTFIETVEVVIHQFNRKDIFFIQIGEFSKLSPNLIELVKAKKLESNILFLNKLEKASSVVSQFDIFLMTSEREGGPTSVLEAMLIGVPVVSTQVGVIPEVIIQGNTGFYAPVKDAKQLASKVIELLDDKMLQEKCSKNAKHLIDKKFNSKVIAQKTLALYKQIIES